MSPSSNPMAGIIARVVRLRNRGLSYTQIARRVGTTKGAVAGILYRARNPRPARAVRPDLDISLVSDLPVHEARYILAVTMGLGLSATGRIMGRTPPTIAYSCRKIEDRRDDPEYEIYITSVETAKLRQAVTQVPEPSGEPVVKNAPHRRSAREQVSQAAGTPRPRMNNAQDREVRTLLDQLTTSGLTDAEVQRRAGLGGRTIEGWRRGRTPTPFLVECVREVLTDHKNTPGS